MRITEDQVLQNIAQESYLTHGVLTICLLTLQNGFIVSGESACADSKNYNAVLGQEIARGNAINKIWPLMGYELKSQLARGETPQAKPSTYIDRMRAEKTELRIKMLNLSTFLGSAAAQKLTMREVNNLVEQHSHMERYHAVLSRRLTDATEEA